MQKYLQPDLKKKKAINSGIKIRTLSTIIKSCMPVIELSLFSFTNIGGMTWPSAFPNGLNREETVVAISRSLVGNQRAEMKIK